MISKNEFSTLSELATRNTQLELITQIYAVKHRMPRRHPMLDFSIAMLPIIKTDRLLLRPLQDADLPAFIAMYADAEVMRYIGDGETKDEQHARSTFERFRNHPVEGFGIWSAEQLSDSACIGWFALKDLDNRPEIEIGYRLMRRYWGKGYATEGSKRLMQYGFETMGLKEIVAVTHFENKASQRVLEKCGLKNIGTTFAYGSDCRYFKKSMP